ncbi:MAG: tRNA (5-methylaminomethyl-2-thiouridine)(34)-methyltransferase MnmD [Bacteroidia bacterium]|jgi:tRNA U34 5-methylaminomethyl-2-thiouridine-forming methyltransferase MnmC|nr:tRNA (5-methylaminomethyl-2-thiouridine)(34)-methyltransferase MnmD [Bacteroidia bacterium]
MSNDFGNRQLITTADGSHSLFVPALNEHYHSVHGAVQESLHVFLRMGFDEAVKNHASLRILEIGFGTGLNAWLTLLAAGNTQVHYTSLEAYPVETKQALALNYPAREGAQGNAEIFAALHHAAWNDDVKISPAFTLHKIHSTLENFAPAPGQFHLIYFDAFAPRVQPELWTQEVFEKMFHASAAGAIITTYCAKGQVRRNMQAAGFVVERLQGPPGKREMLRGRKE